MFRAREGFKGACTALAPFGCGCSREWTRGESKGLKHSDRVGDEQPPDWLSLSVCMLLMDGELALVPGSSPNAMFSRLRSVAIA